MTAALVFLHGRRQEFKDVEALKRIWVKGLNAGLELGGFPSVDVNHVTMPFYGNVLYHVTAGSTGTPIRLESPDAPAPFHPTCRRRSATSSGSCSGTKRRRQASS
jgi:hypothetical protein